MEQRRKPGYQLYGIAVARSGGRGGSSNKRSYSGCILEWSNNIIFKKLDEGEKKRS